MVNSFHLLALAIKDYMLDPTAVLDPHLIQEFSSKSFKLFSGQSNDR